MRSLIVSLATLLVSASMAFGQQVTGEITGYRSINVGFSSKADGCNLSDQKMFADHLAKELTTIGINQFDGANLEANLGINGTAAGLIPTNCVLFTQLTFTVVLSAQNIRTSNPAALAALRRLQTVPVTIYSAGRFGSVSLKQPAKGGPSVSAQNRVLEDISAMVKAFAEKRAK